MTREGGKIKRRGEKETEYIYIPAVLEREREERREADRQTETERPPMQLTREGGRIKRENYIYIYPS